MVHFLGTIRPSPTLSCFAHYRHQISLKSSQLSVPRNRFSPFRRIFQASLQSSKFHPCIFLLVLLFLAVIYYQMAIIFNGYVWLLRIERTIGREVDLNNINCSRKWHVKWGGMERMTFGRIEWLKSIYMADLISLLRLRIHCQLRNFRIKAWLLLMFDFLCIEVCLNRTLFFGRLDFWAVVFCFLDMNETFWFDIEHYLSF